MQQMIWVFILLATFTNSASAIVVNSFDNGWYAFNGGHDPDNTNVFTGFIFPGFTVENRSFFAFDLGSLSVTTITDASIKFFAGNGINAGDDLNKQLGLFDYAGSIDALLGGSAGSSAFTDLGTGSGYGSTTVSKASAEAVPMPEVVLDLSASAIADLNAVLGSLDRRFVIGAALTETYSTDNYLWGRSGGVAASLIINESNENVPTPSTIALLSLGLLAAGFRKTRPASGASTILRN